MNTEDSLRSFIHREMRTQFAWHRIEKMEPKGSGYSIIVSVQPNSREYLAAVNLTTALKRHYRDVNLNKTVTYPTIAHNSIYSMFISCQRPRVVALHSNGKAWNSLHAA